MMAVLFRFPSGSDTGVAPRGGHCPKQRRTRAERIPETLVGVWLADRCVSWPCGVSPSAGHRAREAER